MNLGASQPRQPKPALMEIACLPDRPCSVALGMVKITQNPTGFVVACLQHSLELHKHKAGTIPSKLTGENSAPE